MIYDLDFPEDNKRCKRVLEAGLERAAVLGALREATDSLGYNSGATTKEGAVTTTSLDRPRRP